jgi:hypothetical protein
VLTAGVRPPLPASGLTRQTGGQWSWSSPGTPTPSPGCPTCYGCRWVPDWCSAPSARGRAAERCTATRSASSTGPTTRRSSSGRGRRPAGQRRGPGRAQPAPRQRRQLGTHAQLRQRQPEAHHALDAHWRCSLRWSMNEASCGPRHSSRAASRQAQQALAIMTEDGKGNARVHERVNACYRSASGRPAGDEEVNAGGIAATRGMVGWLSSRDARFLAPLKAHLPRMSGRDSSRGTDSTMRPDASLRTNSGPWAGTQMGRSGLSPRRRGDPRRDGPTF